MKYKIGDRLRHKASGWCGEVIHAESTVVGHSPERLVLTHYTIMGASCDAKLTARENEFTLIEPQPAQTGPGGCSNKRLALGPADA